MKRISLWVLVTLSCLVLLLGYRTSTSSTLHSSASSSFEASTASGSSGSSSSASGSTSGSTDSGSASGSGSSGSGSGSTTAAKTVAGSVAQTQWGPVQVQLTVVAQKITKVALLQYPNGNGRDQEINDYALPILTQETVDAQSAAIDMVSGATVTSDGYLESLQSALDQAGL